MLIQVMYASLVFPTTGIDRKFLVPSHQIDIVTVDVDSDEPIPMLEVDEERRSITRYADSDEQAFEYLEDVIAGGGEPARIIIMQ